MGADKQLTLPLISTGSGVCLMVGDRVCLSLGGGKDCLESDVSRSDEQ